MECFHLQHVVQTSKYGVSFSMFFLTVVFSISLSLSVILSLSVHAFDVIFTEQLVQTVGNDILFNISQTIAYSNTIRRDWISTSSTSLRYWWLQFAHKHHQYSILPMDANKNRSPGVSSKYYGRESLDGIQIDWVRNLCVIFAYKTKAEWICVSLSMQCMLEQWKCQCLRPGKGMLNWNKQWRRRRRLWRRQR